MARYIVASTWLFHAIHGISVKQNIHYGRRALSAMSMTSQEKFFKNSCRLALCQIKVTADKELNIEIAKNAIKKSSEGSAQMIVLPEVWNSPYATSSFPKYAEPIPAVGEFPNPDIHPSIYLLSKSALLKQIWIVGGSIPEREIDSSGKERLYNTCVVLNPDGVIVGKHRKVHLFDIDVPGRITFKESDSLSPGESVTIVDTPWGKIGVGICYDIRFPELALIMRKRGCRMLLYPGAFNMVTGPAHWELLQRARAVDNQVYVAACSPARDETGSYVAWGHSSIINPWGEVVNAAGAGEEVIFADLDFSQVDAMRQNIPCWSQKRHDMYDVIDKQK
jgi:omega-amidase